MLYSLLCQTEEYTGDKNAVMAWLVMVTGDRWKTVLKPGTFPEGVDFKEPSRWTKEECNQILNHMAKLRDAGQPMIEFISEPPTARPAGMTGPNGKKRKAKRLQASKEDDGKGGSKKGGKHTADSEEEVSAEDDDDAPIERGYYNGRGDWPA